MSVFWPYRWKSVMVVFSDDVLDESVLSEKNRLSFVGRKFSGKTVIQAGKYRPFGKKPADNLALKMMEDETQVITIEPAEQVFFAEYAIGKDPNALYLSWLRDNFGDVTLSEDIEEGAAAEIVPIEVSVTRTCAICGIDISDRRADATTCSPAHRKALSRREK